MSGHTPGPWGVRLVNREPSIPDTVAYRPVYVVLGDRDLLISKSADGDADARLIAAAPCLLEALAALLPDAEANHVGGPDTQQRIDDARAAIAKAKGESA